MLESKQAPKGADEYWVKATMVEAYVGLGDEPKARDLLEAARKVDISAPSLDTDATRTSQAAPSAVPRWMIQTTEDQLARLRELLAQSPLSRIK